MFWRTGTVSNDEIWTRGQEKLTKEKTKRKRANAMRNEPDEAWSREHRSCSGSCCCGGGSCIVDLRIAGYNY